MKAAASQTAASEHPLASDGVVAEDSARAARSALGADWAACVLVERGHVTDAVASGAPGEPFGDCVGRPMDGCPIWSALHESGGLIYTVEDCASLDGELRRWADTHEVGALVAIDLVLPRPAVAPVTAGILVAAYDAPREITAANQQNALSLGGVVALAVASATLCHEAETRSNASAELAEEQSALRRVATAVARGAEPSTIFNMVAEESARLLEGDMATVAMFVEEQAEVVGRWSTEAQVGVRYPLIGNRAVAQVARTGRPWRIDDYPKLRDEDAHSRTVVPTHYGSGVAAPIWVGNRLWGAILTVRTKDGERFASDAEFKLQRFSDLVALGISGAQLRETLEEEASTDPLTGLPNRRRFERLLRSEAARAKRYRRELSLAMVDIDHFKAINDSYGHEVGDRALREVARRLEVLARRGELVARIGGEEFAWLLPETDALGALSAAQRARAAIAASPIDDCGQLTISVGVCSLAEAGGAQELLGCADRALYWAKAQGRDMAVAYTDEPLDANETEARVALDARMQARAAILALARTVDAKDRSTLLHSERVADLACRLAGVLGWSTREISLLREAGLLHDVGKIGVPDEVLQKRGRLSSEEYELVRAHPALGAQIAQEVLTAEQAEWIRGHHERWDGTGYPDQLIGESISEGARLLAIADAWDTMTSERPYQSPTGIEAALTECRRQACRQFCPTVVDALLQLAVEDALDAPDPGRWVESAR